MEYIWNTKWQAFLQSEWDKHLPENRDQLCHVADPLIHYERTLRTIAARHAGLQARFAILNVGHAEFMKRPSPRSTSAEERRVISERGDVTSLISLEIETFYLFAKIFLDRIAVGVEQWFGSVRGTSLSSHSKMIKNLERYVGCHSIEIRPNFYEHLSDLEKRISHFRDYQITHERGLHTLRGMFYGNGQEPRLVMSQAHSLVANGTDGSARSENIDSLMIAVDEYIDSVIDMFDRNRSKGRYFRPRPIE